MHTHTLTFTNIFYDLLMGGRPPPNPWMGHWCNAGGQPAAVAISAAANISYHSTAPSHMTPAGRRRLGRQPSQK